VLLVACSLSAARAESDDSIHFHIVVVGHDPELIQALGWVMEGQGTGVTSIGDRPTPSLAELGPESRRLADAHHAIATVWILTNAAGATLVTYERTADRFVVREVPYKLPLDATQAAETARMVRVMLRAVRDRNHEAITRRVRIPRPSQPRDPQLAASAVLGAWFATPEATAVAMTGLTLAWRPHGFGAAVSATLAAMTELETPTFRGDVRVWRIAAEARKALLVVQRVRVSPGVGLALHAVTLNGRLGADGTLESRRYNPALQLSTLVGVALPHQIELGLAISADCLLRRQRYEVGTERLLDVSRIQAMLGILVGIRL
jgi:hypothetical protein